MVVREAGSAGVYHEICGDPYAVRADYRNTRSCNALRAVVGAVMCNIGDAVVVVCNT
jgi:hypothetical protein